MKVYVVLDEEWGDLEVLRIFKSKVKANKFVKQVLEAKEPLTEDERVINPCWIEQVELVE